MVSGVLSRSKKGVCLRMLVGEEVGLRMMCFLLALLLKVYSTVVDPSMLPCKEANTHRFDWQNPQIGRFNALALSLT